MNTSSPTPSGSRRGLVVAGTTIERPVSVVGFAVVVALLGLGLSQLLPIAFFNGLAALDVTLPILLGVTVQLLLVELVGFGVSTWGYLRLRGLSPDYIHVRLPTLRDAGWMGGGTVLVVVLYFAVVSTAVAAGVAMPRSAISLAGEGNPDILILTAALSFVLIGPMEELFFRGVVQETMREVLPSSLAVVLASATFASIHYLTMVGPFVGKLVVLGSLFVTSLVFGFAYERTRNLLVNAVIHGGYNATLLMLAYLVFRSGLAPM